MTEAILPSSPLSSAPSSHPQLPTTSSQQMSAWRSPRELAFEIHQYVRIYFEESLFTKALDFLLAIVTSDASSLRREITVPPPEHLALLATLVVHPWITTRTRSEEKWAEANAALRLLQLLLKTIGPVNARFKDAFNFNKLYVTANDCESNGSIKHPFANEDSVWNRADDFWAVVGWALNCSCLPEMYAARWEHWQLWLAFMADVLEKDWQYHVTNQSTNESILWRYVSHVPGDNARPRRIVRAIFADGSRNSLNEFREVFKGELKGPKQESDKSKTREAVDIDNEVYGDYLAQDESDATSENETWMSNRASTRALSARRITPRTSRQSLRTDFEEDGPSPPVPGLGPPESITIRMRLMQLLVHMSSHINLTQSHRTINFPDPTDLFTLFVEFIKPLPLSVFQQMTTPQVCTTSTFSIDAYTTLLEFLLQRLLETTSSSLPPLQPLTQTKLETDYLPFAANKNNVDANARVGLCVEGLLRSLANSKSLSKSQGLTEAVEKGVGRRMAKVKEKREKAKEGSEEEAAWCWLTESEWRMRSVVRRLTERK